ncbi:MAG: molybdopterin molybdotransferase [Myxococcota bacterium]|jgi:molybdopterin molybdotransferase
MSRQSIEDARAAVVEGLLTLNAESIPLGEALGRVLSEDVCGDRDQPPFNRSAMDGFAVRAADTDAADSGSVELRIVGEVAAGAVSDRHLETGEAIRIMTGAPVPSGADAVQMVENTESKPGETRVRIVKSVRPGQHIAPRGQDLRKGEVAVEAGSVVTPSRLGVCWSFGAQTVSVVRRPRVVVLTTGDELVELHQTPLPHQIRDSNRASVGALVTRAGGEVISGGIVADTLAATREAIAGALLRADVVVLSGGVSMGEYDYVAAALQDEGVEQVFHRVHMKPGKPLWYGRKGQTHVFGLPGNPASAIVTAKMFLVPVIRGLAGFARRFDPVLKLPLLTSFGRVGNRPTFQPAVVHWGEGVELLKTHGSGDLKHFSEGTALALLPPSTRGIVAGTFIDVHLDADALTT